MAHGTNIERQIEDLVVLKDEGDDRLSAWEYDFIENMEERIESQEPTRKQVESIEELWRRFCT